MRAWKIQILIYSITAFAASGYSVFAPAAVGWEPASTNEKTDSVPVAHRPLPETSAIRSQKPTIAPYSNSKIAIPGWKLEEFRANSGFQKPSHGTPAAAAASTLGPSGNSVQTASLEKTGGQPLPPCDVAETTAIPRHSAAFQGSRKPALASPPAESRIVPVKWDAASRSLDSAKMNRHGLAFQGECCPFVLWNPDSPGEFLSDATIDSAPLGSCSDLSIVQDVAGRVRLASLPMRISSVMPDSTHNIAPDYLAELQQLSPDVVPSQSSDAGEHYLAELQQLLKGKSDWLFANAALLDLAPEEGTPAGDTYLDDLRGLVQNQGSHSRPNYTQTGARQESPVSPKVAVPAGQDSGSPYSNIAPDPKCVIPGGSGIDVLFQPMARIQIRGLSTSPPTRNRKATSEEPTELQRPENDSCAYLESHPPVCYFVPPRYGACRPPRGVHQLWHQPLYYEDPNLERCGRSSGCLTTAVSAVHFGTMIAFTPYLTAANCPNSCEKSLSDCPTCHSFGHDAYWPGWSWKGAAAEAAAVTGLYFIVP